MIKKIFSVIIFLMAPVSVSAQEYQSPAGLFKENYVNEAFSDSGQKNAGVIRRKKEEDPSGRKRPVSGEDFSPPPEQPAATPAQVNYSTAPGKRVVWLGAIISANEAEHLKEKLEELTTEATAHDLMIGPVFLVGGNAAGPEVLSYLPKLQKREGLVNFRSEVPKKYSAVKLSPTWIFQTEEGQILVEAVGPLKRHFNQQGEFVLTAHN